MTDWKEQAEAYGSLPADIRQDFESAMIKNPAPAHADRDDIEMLFRCIMQFARHLAKKYNFTIKQWPEK